MPTYNTIMSLAAGVGLLLVVALGYQILTGKSVVPDSWALAFGVLGLILFATGLHMTLTWPLAGQGFPFDNVIFGEPSLAFGVLLLAASLYLWKRGAALEASGDRPRTVAVLSGPVSLLVFGLGLACLAIAAAGWKYTLFAAPPEEPISGEFADHPLLEASFMSMLYVLVGVGAILFPLVLRRRGGAVAWVVGVCWTLGGLAFLLFGALNYFTHIGLIVNTM
ncbi:DUF981 family protein [Streptomyces brevispora]|uniref:DUF981 domain-containing protein n=1 Tax=Streptomyces brevispora TaxID=887462 RepID=A0A561UUI6_9ACTN|nr:DUF981 family protein [Streptomyces brevispora]TWG03030.1 putative membrane protein [Streptomyces brevispora]WSC17996.1 DUF981 domain-containing protein [Streptomyces brevispora]